MYSRSNEIKVLISLKILKYISTMYLPLEMISFADLENQIYEAPKDVEIPLCTNPGTRGTMIYAH